MYDYHLTEITGRSKMKRSTKALLLSFLVFPGSGHIYLKQYITGLTIMSISIVSLYYLVVKATEQAFKIVAEIQNGNVPLDPIAINELITRQQASADNLWLNIATAAVSFCWVIGIIDTYRIGSKLEKSST
jgi:hypothetical protein